MSVCVLYLILRGEDIKQLRQKPFYSLTQRASLREISILEPERLNSTPLPPVLTWYCGSCVRRLSSLNSSWMLVTSASVLSDVQRGGWAVPFPMFTSEKGIFEGVLKAGISLEPRSFFKWRENTPLGGRNVWDLHHFSCFENPTSKKEKAVAEEAPVSQQAASEALSYVSWIIHSCPRLLLKQSVRGQTHSFLQEELVPRKMVGAQQTPQDADGRLKEVHVHVLAEGEIVLHPAPRLGKL